MYNCKYVYKYINNKQSWLWFVLSRWEQKFLILKVKILIYNLIWLKEKIVYQTSQAGFS